MLPGVTVRLSIPIPLGSGPLSGAAMSRSERQCNIQIRLAIADEAESIAWVLHQAFAEYESLYTAAAFAITTPTRVEIEQRLKEGPVWSALKNGRLVGTVAAVAKGDALYIRSMAVVPSARGQGIGKYFWRRSRVSPGPVASNACF